jgi:hypothetical protein
MNARVTISSRCSLQQTKLALLLDKGGAMTAYVIVQLKMIDRAAYDRYQARFFGVFKKFSGRLRRARRRAAGKGMCAVEGEHEIRGHHHGP